MTAAKRGGNRQAPAAAAKTVAAGAPASPAEEQDTLIPAPVAVPEVEEATTTVDLLKAVADAVATGAGDDVPATAPDAETPEPDPIAIRLAALAALTGAPTTEETAPVAVPEVEANGDEVTWADGDEELVTGIVAFSVYQARVAGRTKQAYKGQTLRATEAVIARGVALGAVVRAV